MPLKHLADATYAIDQCIDVLTCVVKGEAGSACALDSEASHEGFGTMMACADGYAEAVEQRSHVEVVDVANLEGDDGVVLLQMRTVNLHAFHFHESLHGVGRQVFLVGLNGIEANRADVIECFGEPRRSDVVRRACLEFIVLSSHFSLP